MNQRSFRRFVYMIAISLAWAILLSAQNEAALQGKCSADDQPNILWLTSEDNGPHLGCYGDDYATTPNLDAFAKRGFRYEICWSNVPVCAPARTCLITGVYPCSIGAEHMRSMIKLDSRIKLLPQILREHGYYCSNNRKEDYNFKKPKGAWDDSSKKAHWKNRKAGQPFFSVFNHTISHESQIRKRPHTPFHDPAKVRVPAYHPDRPEVRQDWAQYYDKLMQMDKQVGRKLKELADAGLQEETIVFYFADHGSGMPRHKRSVTNSGLHVPLLIYIPEKYKHFRCPSYNSAGSTDRLVAFVDFAPTVLSLAGIKPPSYMQGKAFLGRHIQPAKSFLFGMRGRMDERMDLSRSIRSKNYIYIRHLMPHLPEGQHLHYQFQTPTTRVWKKAFDEGKLNPAQRQFWVGKPPEQLFDLSSDPDQVHNLIDDEDERTVLIQMRENMEQIQFESYDRGLYSEIAFHADENLSRQEHLFNPRRYTGPVRSSPSDLSLLITAKLCASIDFANERNIRNILSTPEHDHRYWASNYFVGRVFEDRNKQARDYRWKLSLPEIASQFAKENHPDIAINLAFVLGWMGDEKQKDEAIEKLIQFANVSQTENDAYISIAALNALDYLDGNARPWKTKIATLPRQNEKIPARMSKLIDRLLTKILSDLE